MLCLLTDSACGPSTAQGYLRTRAHRHTKSEPCGHMHTYTRAIRRVQVYVIDVSQSVDLDHPKALDFLREDCQHVNDFFKRAGVATLTVRELFDLVTDPLVTDANRDEVLETLQQVRCRPASLPAVVRLLPPFARTREPCGLLRWPAPSHGSREIAAQLCAAQWKQDRARHDRRAARVQLAASRPLALTAEAEVEEAVFRQAYIPRKLEEVEHFERDAQLLQAGRGQGIYFQAISGLGADGTVAADGVPKVLTDALAALRSGGSDAAAAEGREEDGAATSGDEGVALPAAEDAAVASGGEGGATSDTASSEGGGSDSEDGPNGEWVERAPVDRAALKDARKANKKAVKEERAAKRLDKVPKKVKKRAEKKGSQRK